MALFLAPSGVFAVQRSSIRLNSPFVSGWITFSSTLGGLTGLSLTSPSAISQL